MIKIAIAGNIASGKSELEKLLQKRGFKVVDSDKIAHFLLEDNQDIIKTFKDYDIFELGKISRKKLGEIVFSNPELKNKLEQILHPQIKNEISKFFAINQNEKAIFVSIPLLFEANMDSMFDKIIFVYANDEIRLNRLIARNNYSKEYAQIRINSQISQEEKIKKSDFVIYNETSIEDLEKQLNECLDKIKNPM